MSYAPKDEQDEPWNPRKLLIRAHQEEQGRTFHKKMDMVLQHVDIAMFDANQSVKEQMYHNAIQSYGNAYRASVELQKMLEATLRQLIDYKQTGDFDRPFKPTI